MAYFRFVRGTRFNWAGTLYEVDKQLLTNQHKLEDGEIPEVWIQLHDVDFNQIHTELESTLDAAWLDDKLIFVPKIMSEIEPGQRQ